MPKLYIEWLISMFNSAIIWKLFLDAKKSNTSTIEPLILFSKGTITWLASEDFNEFKTSFIVLNGIFKFSLS